MRSLGQATRHKGQMAAELPLPWPSLRNYGVSFRQGQMSLLVAAPGGGKSILALLYAIETKVPTLFFSADTDLVTMAIRAGAAVLGWPQDTVEHNLDSQEVTDALREIDHIKWCDQAQPTVQDIYSEVRGYLEVVGESPRLIVVDNLIDVQTDEDGWAGTRAAVDALKKLARESEAHVLTLAHATGKYEDGRDPIPLSGLEYKPGKNVELVLTMYRPEDTNELRLCPVKNRGGVASAAAAKYVSLYADLAHCSVHDPATGPWLLGRVA